MCHPISERNTRRIALRIMYDGTDFVGWQRQPNGRSVQQELERLLGRICGDRTTGIVGAGRTDSGVHATGQVAHADVVTRYDDLALLHALQRMSPPDLAVVELVEVTPDFHARYHAYRRRYRYRLIDRPDPFLARYAWQPGMYIDIEILNAAAQMLCGQYDFTTLSKYNPDTPNAVCHVVHAEWCRLDNGVEFHIEADRFLYGMVRMIVGVQLDVVRGRRRLEELPEMLQARDRQLQSMAVPPQGLSLMEVRYPKAIFQG